MSDSGTDVFALSEVIASLERTRSSEIGSLNDEQICAGVKLIELARRGLDALSLRMLAELDSRGSTDSLNGMRTGAWLAHESGTSGRASHARVAVANKLRRHLRSAGDALDAGRIGYEHAKVLADAANPRIIDEFAAMVPELVDLAQLIPFDRWTREVRSIANILDADGGHRPGDDITDNRLRIGAFGDGTVVIDGQLAGDAALLVAKALQERADRLFRKFDRDSRCSELPVPPRRTLLALALVELVREAAGLTKQTGRPRSEISLIINAEDPLCATTTEGIPIGDTTAACVSCDPVFRPIVMNTKGIVTDVGRQHRLVTDAQRRAMAHRDGGCVFPGCEAPPEWTDAHHVIHWRAGGPTDKANLASLCRYHHGVSHRRNWTMTSTEDQHFIWTTPEGRTLHSQRHRIQQLPT